MEVNSKDINKTVANSSCISPRQRKGLKLLVFLFLLAHYSHSQEVKSPRVLVLTPLEFHLDDDLISESREYKMTMTDEEVAECIRVKNENEDREFVYKMNEAECEFARNSDLSTTFTYYLYGWLTFKLYGTFDDAVLYPAKGPKTRNMEAYSALSEAYDVNWIVDVKSVDFKIESDNRVGLAKLEVWNKNTNEMTLTTQVEIDSENHGGEMTCEDGTISCLIMNGVVYMSYDILKSMFSEERYWR